ncbi:thiol:disulfide interchange protein DsbD [Amorphus orientalis]|uniref:Thiol:disulfide interchange protein DsbD n=2 Tax=Amorphus orientalis TaxID=649198 RepID=A0AAE3VN75_9HYPH|nr:thiol:disulfide interchange protein DsbD [Amorphus orientalis]
MLALVLSGPPPAMAQNAAITTDQVDAAILIDTEIAAPGSEVRVAIRQTLADGWHTYWKNPGDSGAPTEVDWTLPDGVSAGPLRWPTPERIPYPPLINYGYSGSATLLTSLTVPQDWPAGEPVEADLAINWLVCSDICIPQSGAVRLSIPTGPEAEPDSAVAFTFLNAERALPTVVDWPAGLEADGDRLVLTVEPDDVDPGSLREAYFFPAEWGVVDHSAAQELDVRDGRLVLALAPDGKAASLDDSPVAGVLALTDDSGKRTGYAIGNPDASLTTPAEQTNVAALPAAPATPPASAAGSGPDGGSTAPGGGATPGLLRAIVFAFLGGLILNLMPCVFPVLALKAVSFAGHSHEAAPRRIAQGLSYTAGILLSFLALAGALLAIKSGGTAAGWGFQLQQPLVVAALAYLLVLVGLNLSGVFEIGLGLTRTGNVVHGRSGLSGSFLTGVLAAVVATPCTAPFMAVAIGFALTQGTAVTLAVFTALGLGLALPFLLISSVPALGHALPKPGAWMIRLRQVLAFPIFATAAWLIWVLAQQAGVDAMFAALIGCVVLAFAAWLFGLSQGELKRGRRIAAAAAVLGLLAAVGLLAPTLTGTAGPAVAAPGTDPAGDQAPLTRLAALRDEGKPVFLNVTAAWCITCKVNENVAFGSRFEDALVRNDVTYLTADWTRRDPDITRLLERHGRAGVPLYLVYPAGSGTPEVLPQILTEGLVVKAIEKAGAPRS